MSKITDGGKRAFEDKKRQDGAVPRALQRSAEALLADLEGTTLIANLNLRSLKEGLTRIGIHSAYHSRGSSVQTIFVCLQVTYLAVLKERVFCSAMLSKLL